MAKSSKKKFVPEFPGQREDEEIIMILLRHWYVIALPAAKALLIILLSFVLPIAFNFANIIFGYAISTTVYYLWIVFWIAYILYEYVNWYRDKFIVTNQRVVDVDQRGLFRRRVTEMELERIENIGYEIKGFFPTLLNFGTILLQADHGEMQLKFIAEPALIQEDITQLTKEKK